MSRIAIIDCDHTKLPGKYSKKWVRSDSLIGSSFVNVTVHKVNRRV
ncbi:MAG: hypothetical protein ACXW2I_14100 [Burkholderiales bacterium]